MSPGDSIGALQFTASDVQSGGEVHYTDGVLSVTAGEAYASTSDAENQQYNPVLFNGAICYDVDSTKGARSADSCFRLLYKCVKASRDNIGCTKYVTRYMKPVGGARGWVGGGYSKMSVDRRESPATRRESMRLLHGFLSEFMRGWIEHAGVCVRGLGML